MARPPDTNAQPEWLELGIIVRPHGVRGELRFVPHDLEVDLPDPPVAVRVRTKAGAPLQTTITHRRTTEGAYLIYLEAISDRTAAEKVKGARVDIDGATLPAAAADEAYVFELVGAEAVDREGQPLGVVKAVLKNPGHDLLAIDTPGGERLVPLVPAVLVRFERKERRVVLAVPEGLWDD
jgi:16S rRNA processing protein RimM